MEGGASKSHQKPEKIQTFKEYINEFQTVFFFFKFSIVYFREHFMNLWTKEDP